MHVERMKVKETRVLIALRKEKAISEMNRTFNNPQSLNESEKRHEMNRSNSSGIRYEKGPGDLYSYIQTRRSNFLPSSGCLFV